MNTHDKESPDARNTERRKLLERADKLSDFGTITSLGSTAFYFVEQLLERKIPRWLNALTLTGVGAGITAIYISMRDKIKAGNLPARIPETGNAMPPQKAKLSANPTQAQQNKTLSGWVDKEAHGHDPTKDISR